MVRASGLVIAVGLLTTACSACGGGSSGGTGGATTTTPGTTTTSVTTGTTTGTTTTATGAKPKAPVLESVSAKHPGLGIAWSEPTPCDTVEGEREDMLNPYPSQATPPGPPLFSVPGTTKTYLDTAPTQNMLYTYHVRCKTAGGTSDWSNELAANPTL